MFKALIRGKSIALNIPINEIERIKIYKLKYCLINVFRITKIDLYNMVCHPRVTTERQCPGITEPLTVFLPGSDSAKKRLELELPVRDS